jgi:hypothetical protein
MAYMADKKITPKAAAAKDKASGDDRAAARVSLKRTTKRTGKKISTKRTTKKL